MVYALPWLVYVLPCSDSIPLAKTSVKVELQKVMQAALRYQAAHWHAVIAASNDPREGV
jgi:hypothetical protein